MLHDLSDQELFDAGPMKWALDEPGTIPAWIAEMDFAIAPAISAAVKNYVKHEVFGYPDLRLNDRVVQAFAGFAQRRWSTTIPIDRVFMTGDVMEGMRLTLEHVVSPGAIIVPTPVYPPFLVLGRDVGREVIEVQMRGGHSPHLDMTQIEEAAADGASVILLCHPHNPLGRVWSPQELTQIAELARGHDLHVISDEIHAPLIWPGVDFTSYLSVLTDTDRATVLTSATKSFSMPGLRCAQVISNREEDHRLLADLHPVLNHSMSTLGLRAAIAAYTDSDPWLDAVRERISNNHALFTELLGQQLPHVQCARSQATYLAWVDVSQVSEADPVACALAAGVRVDGQDYGRGTSGHVRVNLATSPERVREIVARLATAWAQN